MNVKNVCFSVAEWASNLSDVSILSKVALIDSNFIKYTTPHAEFCVFFCLYLSISIVLFCFISYVATIFEGE